MPTYDYVCTSCGNAWEEVQKITAPALEDCPKCHGKTAKRQVSGGNFILKGGGWYADLYSSPKSSGTTSKGEGKADAPASSTAPAAGAGTTPSSSSSPSGSGGSTSGSSGSTPSS